MIKLEHVVLASPEQMKFIIEGMRNPMNSWEKSDSNCCAVDGFGQCMGCDHPDRCMYYSDFYLGENDHSLMQRLANTGMDHRKFMRMMPVYVRITAPLYWWKEFDTYKVGTVANSCSSMHKIQDKEFTLEDFSHEHLMYANQSIEEYHDNRKDSIRWSATNPIHLLNEIIGTLNYYREKYLEYELVLKSKELANREEIKEKRKQCWWQMIQLLPSSYNQTRNVMMNYEVLANIYKSRKDHKLDEWRELCKWIKELPYSELIVGKEED